MRTPRAIEILVHVTIVPRHFGPAISATYTVVGTDAMPVDIPEIDLPIKICT